MWQWRESRNDEWHSYSDIENAIIENAYKGGNKQVELDNNVIIDLKKNIQKNINNKSVETRRVSINNNNNERTISDENRKRRDRFYSAPIMAANDKNVNLPFGAGDWNGSKFVFEWQMKCHNHNLESLTYADIMHQALEGLHNEGNQLGHIKESQWILDHYLPVCKESSEDIFRASVRLYTMESFVYSLINRTLRENDLSKIETLGPFCYILFQFNFASEFKNFQFSGPVYRGANLTSSQIMEYERAIGSVRSWLGFTSTSRQRQIAESFPGSTVLFIINIQETATCAAKRIADLSLHSYEDEVLIRAGQHFTINRVERNESAKNSIKALIYLTIE